MIKDFILKNLVFILALALALASGLALYYKYQNAQTAYLLAKCEKANLEKTKNVQQIADKSAESFEKEKVIQNENFKVIEREYRTIVEKTPEIHYLDCTTDDALQLLQQVYAARDSSELKNTATSTGSTNGN